MNKRYAFLLVILSALTISHNALSVRKKRKVITKKTPKRKKRARKTFCGTNPLVKFFNKTQGGKFNGKDWLNKHRKTVVIL